MRRYWPLLLFVVIFAGVFLRGEPSAITPPVQANTDYQRLVSLAPSITETIFALGSGDKLVGVTDYCTYPVAAQSLPKVGGYIDTRIEAVLNQQPDLVIMLKTQQQLEQQLNQLGIKTLAVDNSRLETILHSIKLIGEQTGHQQQAQNLLQSIEQKIKQVQQKVAALPSPRVLISIAHYNDADSIEQVYIAGQHDFYNDLVTLAGGSNVYQDTLIKVPSLTTEGIIQLNPDVIIDVIPEQLDHPVDLQQIRHQWQSLAMLNAVKQNRIHLIMEDYASIPGPRIFNLLPLFGQILYPQLDWTEFTDD